jgi:hypothetical protein
MSKRKQAEPTENTEEDTREASEPISGDTDESDGMPEADAPHAQSGEATEEEPKTEPETPKPPPMKVEPYTTTLRVILSKEEIAERADRAAHLLADRDNKEKEQKDAQKHAKSLIDALETELRHVSAEVRARSTFNEVQCERRYLYAEGKVVSLRLDTGEILSTRPMAEHEKQQEMQFDGAKDKGGGRDLDDDFSDEAAQ